MPDHPTIPPCPMCGGDVPRSARPTRQRLYCSQACVSHAATVARAQPPAVLLRPCRTCGVEMTLTLGKERRHKYHCSRACGLAAMQAANRANPRRGAAAAGWKGGRYPSRGYIRCWAPNHPHADSSGYVREHRLVMERVLGRVLLRSEEVHHINGDRADNRPENLELWLVGRQPKGIRLGDAPHCPTCRC